MSLAPIPTQLPVDGFTTAQPSDVASERRLASRLLKMERSGWGWFPPCPDFGCAWLVDSWVDSSWLTGAAPTAEAGGVAGVGFGGGGEMMFCVADCEVAGLVADLDCNSTELASAFFFDTASRPALMAGVEMSKQRAICFSFLMLIHVGMAFTSCVQSFLED